MRIPEPSSIRRAGLLGAVGGALNVISGAVVQGIVQPASDVSDEMWSYPWSGDAYVPVSLVLAALHVLVFIGVLGFARSGVAGPGRSARVGTVVALTGTAVLFAAQLLSIPIADQRLDDTGAGLVGACFGLGTVLSAIGFIVAGIATMRARRWDGWRRYVPLAIGIWLVALIGLTVTPALATAVALYGLFLTALGIALWTQPTPSTPRPRTEAVQVRL
jgi:hypothetical protein